MFLNFKSKGMYINTWHINKPNGMLYYAIDHINSMDCTKNLHVIVRENKNLLVLNKNLKNHDITIKKYSFIEYIFLYLELLIKSFHSKYKIFTPSTHPLPFYRNQTIVVHDSYPFKRNNLVRIFKYYFLKLMILISNTDIGYINNQDSLSFSTKINTFLKIKKGNLIYLPNKITPIKNFDKKYRKKSKKIFIGLAGTDSAKKNFDKFIKALSKNINYKIEIVLFGFNNKYTDNLKKISDHKITLIDSSENSLTEFLQLIDYIINVSSEEGFCRPIAYAKSVEIPLLTIETPVMREFYNDKNTYFFEDIYSLSKFINNL
tara:strand:- start:541 stop:1494 length:954 start_codon:yes stop_codon:yes gene_type:complete